MLPRRIYIPCFVFLLAIAVGLGCGEDRDPAAPNPVPESDLTLLALGDSYTVGHSLPAAWCWPYQLADTLAAAGDSLASFEVIAKTGWTTGDLLGAVRDSQAAGGLLHDSYGLVALMIGVNNQFKGLDPVIFEVEMDSLINVALDLTGHGLSACRSPDATYQIWDDLPEIVGVLEELGWDRFDLMGHSRGAIIATLFAGTCPERVNNLVLLDAVVPQAVAEADFAQQMRKALKDKSRLLAVENRVFSNTTEAVSSRVRRGIPLSAAEILVERNVRACPGGVTWTTDPRLHGASAVKMTEGQIRAVLGALDMPTQLLLAEESYYQTEKQTDYIEQHIRGLTMHTVPGGHHFHMEPGVAEVAACVHQFLTGIDQRGVA